MSFLIYMRNLFPKFLVASEHNVSGKTFRFRTFLIFGLLAIFPAIATAANSALPVRTNSAGVLLIRNGDYKGALDEILKDTVESDSAFRFFKLAVVHYNLCDYNKSLFLFKLLAKKCPDISPICYEFIGDIEHSQKHCDFALTSYLSALSSKYPDKYKYHIFAKIKALINRDSTALLKTPWLGEYLQWLGPVPQAAQQTQAVDLLDSLFIQKKWSRIDTVLADSSFENDRLYAFAQKVFKNDSSGISSKSIYKIAQAVFSCKKFKFADSLFSLLEKRKDFRESVPQGPFLYLKAQLSYNTGDYDTAIKQYKKYVQKFGMSSDVVMAIARAYRKLDKDDDAGTWYQKFLDLYPSHSLYQEVLWLRAWQLEDKNRYAQAIEDYKKIYTRFPDGNRAEEAYVRQALCYYRMENYKAAVAILDKYIKKNSASSQCLAQYFWKAKCLLALDSLEKARAILSEVSKSEPFDYYSHRSRQLLVIFGDTSGLSIDSIYDFKKAALWLDSISPRNSFKQLSGNDSAYLQCGTFLASVGAIDDADVFLSPLEQSFPGNLRLQFELSTLYLAAEASGPAYRIAHKLTWRIPVGCRSNLPLAVYSLLFPSFYADYILKQANFFNVDPFLVSAVIRQESIFNPKIVSPAGAIGLMQLMPFTGKKVAEKIGDSFIQDSLSSPFSNIKYGTYYLRELLDQFKDNLVLVLAGYNGGPDNAKKWYDKNKSEEFDLFVEDLVFSETRGYVKRVLANYWTYRYLSTIPGYSYGRISVKNGRSVKISSTKDSLGK